MTRCSLKVISHIGELKAFFFQQETVEEDASTRWKLFIFDTCLKFSTHTKDVLSVCANSAPTKKFFSSKQGILTYMRTRLKKCKSSSDA